VFDRHAARRQLRNQWTIARQCCHAIPTALANTGHEIQQAVLGASHLAVLIDEKNVQ
jgi:hypothetical protein